MAERGGGGDRLTLQRARPKLVWRLIALQGLPLAGLTAPPALFAAADGEWPLAGALALAAAPPALAFAHLRWRAEPLGEPRRIEALAAVAAIFLIGALMAAPAFLVLGMPPVDAFFEAVSGITTTGLSVARDAEGWPASAHFMRAWLQWTGGFAFAVAAVALVVGPGVVAMRLGFGGGPGESILGSTRSRARALLGAYLAVSAAALAALAATAASPFEGVLIAMTAVSTAGWSPANDSLASLGALAQTAAMAAMIAGAVSMTLWARLPRRGGLDGMLGDRELRALMALLAAATAGVALIEGLRAGGGAAWAGVVATVSAQTTAGFSAGPTGEMAPAALLLLILAMAVGGSVGSTAGGIKVFRLAFAVSSARLTLSRAAQSPRALAGQRVLGRRPKPQETVEAFALVAMFVFGCGAAWFALMLCGAAPLPALFDSVSAFATAGLSAGPTGPDLHPAGKLTLAAAMLLGRLEFIAFLALVSPTSWVRGN